MFSRSRELLDDATRADVLILANSGGRDTLALVALAAQLEHRHKLRVVVRTAMFRPYFWVSLHRPKVVVHIAIDHPATVAFYRQLGELGVARVALLTEFAVNERDSATFVGRYSYHDLVELAPMPSAGVQELFVKHGRIDAAIAPVVGSPTLDWCVPPWNRFFAQKPDIAARFGLDVNKKWILVCTSFPTADYDLEGSAATYAHVAATAAELETARTEARSARAGFIAAAKFLCAERPDWQVLFKPHPFEDAEPYAELAALPQVRFVSGDIHELMGNVDAHVHWNSTSSIQAWGFRTPTIHFEPESLRSLARPGNTMLQAGGLRAESAAELLACIERGMREPPPPDVVAARDAFVARWCHRFDGRSTERCADEVAALARDARYRHARPLRLVRRTSGAALQLVRVVSRRALRGGRAAPKGSRARYGDVEIDEMRHLRRVERAARPFLDDLLHP